LRPPFLRYITGDAGHVKRLYDAVKIAEEFPDIAKEQRDMLAERKTDSEKSNRYRGLTKARSYEPHQALARELGILEKGERWRITESVGKPFLFLWEKEKIVPPKFLLLAQLLRYDKAMTVPFLESVLKKGEKGDPTAIFEIWDMLWKKFPKEMELAEPPLPFSLKKENGELKRTCKHHSQFRIRFLIREEGLGLQKEQLERIVEVFSNYQQPKFPSDYYSKMGFIITGKKPSKYSQKDLGKLVKSGFKIFQKQSYSSAAAVFHYLNNKILPENFLDSEEFLKFLRTNKNYNLHPSSSENDILFSIGEN